MLKNKTFPVGSSIAPGNTPVQGRSHAMSHKDSLPKIEGRQLPAVTFDPIAFSKKRSALKTASRSSLLSFAPAVPNLAELAAALNNDVDEIYRFVANSIGFLPTFGSQKGWLTTLIERMGNSFDQSALMVALLREAGKTANFVFGQLKLTTAQAAAWLGTDPGDIWAARNLLGNGGIPVDVTWDPVTFTYHLLLSHCWVKVDVTGTGSWYVFDPAFKSHTFTAGEDLATITGFDATTFETAALSGATVTSDYFQDVNTASVNSQIVDLHDNLITWINTNKPDATIKDLVGGRTIDPVVGVIRNATLPYEDSSVAVVVWTDIPNAYKTTFRVQYDTIDETFYSEDISSKNLTLFFNNLLEAELRLDGTLLATSTAQGVGTWNSALLTVNHPYADPWANQSFWQRVWAGQFYLIAHSWGNSTPEMAYMHQKMLNDNIIAGGADTDPEVLGESLAVLWHTWSAQKTIMCSLIGQLSGCSTVLHHQLGMVGQGEAPFTDLGGIVWSTSALDNDYSKVASADTVIALRGIGFESNSINQVPGITAVSSNNIISQANDASQKLFTATSANWTTVRPQLVNYDSGDLDNLKAWYIDNGWTLLIHEDGETDQDDYTGYGIYAISPWGGCVGLINGMLHGGGGAESQTPEELVTKSKYNQQPMDNLDRAEVGPKNEVDIDFVTDTTSGKTIYRHTDLVNGNALGALSFTRTYNNRDSGTVTEMGRGWRHNYMISVEVQNQTFAMLQDPNHPNPPIGHASGLSMSGPLITTMIQVFLAPSSGSLSSFIIGAISTTEASKKLTANVVILRDGDNRYTFTMLSDGTYVPPKGVSMLLTKSGSQFVMQTFEGVRYTFTDWALDTTRISKIEWPSYFLGDRRIDFEYGGTGPEYYLTRVKSNVGSQRSLYFDYTFIGGLVPYLQRVSTAAFGGTACTYTFDPSTTGNLLTMVDPGGTTTTYTYDTKRRLESYNRFGSTYSVTYDDEDRVLTQANPRYTLNFSYGDNDTFVTGGPNGSMQTSFNSDKQPTRIISGGETTSLNYNGLGLLYQKQLPNGDSIQYLYDQYNRVQSEIHTPGPGGGITQTRTYGFSGIGANSWDKWTSHSDERGQSWSRTYDPKGNLISQTGPLVGGVQPTKSWTYDGYNQVLTETDETGIVTAYTYSELGNVATIVRNSGGLNLTTSYTYDGIGNRLTETNPRGFTRTMVYDNMRRVTQITEPAPFGYVTNITYDANSNVLTTSKQTGTSPAWQTITSTYSNTNKLLTQTDSLSNVTTHAYDLKDRHISVTDAESRTRQFQYNGDGQLVVILDATSVAEETRSYNASGSLAAIQDARGNVTTFGRDGFDRIVQISYPDSSTESFSYDVSGNPLVHTMRNGNTISKSYDVLGRLSTKSPQGQAVVTYTYDLANRLLSASTPTVAGNPASGTFSYGFDSAGRQVSETNPQSQTVGYTLDANGNAITITYPGGYFVNRGFDQLDRLVDIKLNGAGTSAVTFSYDGLSRRTSKVCANGSSTSYSYDAVSNLLSMNISFVGSAANWSYTYNKVHQMLSQNCSDDTNYIWKPTAGSVSYGTANNLNQYGTIGGLTPTYNSLGALASYNGWTYSYNTEQMLTGATMTGVSASFVYDPSLRQTMKTVGSAKTKYVYSGSQMLEEWNDVTNALIARYVYAGADEPVLQISSGGTVTYIHHDHHGSVIAQSNASTGAVGNRYKYGPFGESATLVGTTFGYTGQRFDSETGLYHYKARYYHAGIGRFLQPDPVGYQAGMNLYAYCSNDGLNRTDPDGLEPDSPHLREHGNESWERIFGRFATQISSNGEEVKPLAALMLEGAFREAASGASSKAFRDGINVRLRHYTNNSGFNGIKETNYIRASDQNKVFNELANKKPLSRVDAESKYGLKEGRGRNLVEYNASIKEVLVEKNPFTKATEHNIRGSVDLTQRQPNFIKRND